MTEDGSKEPQRVHTAATAGQASNCTSGASFLTTASDHSMVWGTDSMVWTFEHRQQAMPGARTPSSNLMQPEARRQLETSGKQRKVGRACTLDDASARMADLRSTKNTSSTSELVREPDTTCDVIQ